MNSQIRAFIAVELPSEIKDALGDIVSKLKPPAGNSVKWVDPRNIHLTLKFLGNIYTSQLEPISSAMRTACQTASPCQLQIQSAGAFPDLKRVQVIWAGLGGKMDCLVDLQKGLDAELAKLGFAPETKPFSPHLTLGRVRETATPYEKQNIGRSISAASIPPGLFIPIRALSLMESRLLPAGPLYTRLKSHDLAGPLE